MLEHDNEAWQQCMAVLLNDGACQWRMWCMAVVHSSGARWWRMVVEHVNRFCMEVVHGTSVVLVCGGDAWRWCMADGGARIVIELI
jgi:hypothetical protein